MDEILSGVADCNLSGGRFRVKADVGVPAVDQTELGLFWNRKWRKDEFSCLNKFLKILNFLAKTDLTQKSFTYELKYFKLSSFRDK